MSSVQRTRIKLGELCTVGRGSSPRPIVDPRYHENGTIPWVKIADATASGKYLYKTKEYLNDYGASFSRKLKPGALIMATSGTLGYTIKLGISACIHDGWLYFSDYSDNLNPEYLFYLLKTRKEYFENYAYGAAIQNVNTDILRNMEIDLPPRNVQNQIEKILCSYDNLIENNNKRIRVLEEMAQTLYNEWFVNFRFPGHEKVKMVDSELGKIPEGWRCVKIANILDSVKTTKKLQKTKYLDIGYYPVIDQGADFIGGYYNDNNYVFDFPLPVVIFGDHTRILKYIDFSFIRGADGTKVLYSKTLPTVYLYMVLKNLDLGNFHYARHYKFLVEKRVIVPSEVVLKDFTEIMTTLFKQLSILKNKNSVLSKTRDFLIPKLISGEIDVSEMGI